MILPKKLHKSDLIGVVSPSDPIENPESDEQFKSGIKFLENLEFRVLLGNYISSKNPKERAEDINQMFKNKEVKAIIASQGGDSAEKVLPFLDWQIIKENPKIFMGISDITVLLNAINTKTGLITFHGNDVKWGFGKNPSKYDKNEFINRLIKGEKGEITANKERKTIRNGKATGRLIGGNAYCLLKLKHTEFWPDFTDSILFLEEYKPTEEQCIKGINLFKELRVFDKINGVIIGHIFGFKVTSGRQMEDILLELTKNYNFPILKVNDFGHNTPNTTIPLGVKVELDADNKKITILEKFIE